MEYKRQIVLSWKRMVSALLEKVVDRIVMEQKRIVVSANEAWKKQGRNIGPPTWESP